MYIFKNKIKQAHIPDLNKKINKWTLLYNQLIT